MSTGDPMIYSLTNLGNIYDFSLFLILPYLNKLQALLIVQPFFSLQYSTVLIEWALQSEKPGYESWFPDL